MERISRVRAIALLLVFALVMTLYSGKLFSLQIIETDGNMDNTTVYTTVTTVRAARGDILDRNGRVLVGNRASYDLVFNHYVIKSAEGRNDYLYRLYHKTLELGVEYLDHFPLTKTRPFEYTINDYSTAWQNYFQNYMRDCGLDSDISAPLLLEKLRSRYDIPEEWTDEEARAVVGMRYEFDLRGVTNLPTYTFMEDVSDEHLSAILELNTPGLMVESSTVREYHNKYAAHILGYMGGMDADDWEKYKDQNYSMDAYIGQAGFEEAFEEYLHGIDGTRVDVVSRDGTVVQQYYKKEPEAGNNVETTIDLTLQIIAEDALAEVMAQITDPQINTEEGGLGLDAEGAAVIVMEVKTGQILACASYPTYDLATMNQNWDQIEADPLKPFFNRAFGAYYAPGSTFKMCTLTAAMENDLLDYQEKIVDKGVFTEYAGFAPKCLLYSSVPGATHGEIDATDALKVSCNYFFYWLGHLMTIEMLDETSKGFGLGEPTGIELVEKVGWRANKESKKASYTGTNANWTAGDRVLAAIGQSENRFTPLQLCVYACTLANQGTRYRATFLNRVVSSDYRELIKENEPEIVSTMEISWETYDMYIRGMRKVVTELGGTARKYFGGREDPDAIGSFPVAVCAKTGTAE
ncbi:MAG: hypothetical protein IJA71_04285, partial [Clostridia bacterium]|nr:hypothetical protein [Clostridia bacterium]